MGRGLRLQPDAVPLGGDPVPVRHRLCPRLRGDALSRHRDDPRDGRVPDARHLRLARDRQTGRGGGGMKQTSGTAVPTGAARGERAPGARPTKLFELISPNPGIDFIKWAPRMIFLSWLFIVAGLVSIWMRGGLNPGIDFLGGTAVQVRFVQPQSISDVRAALDRPELRAAIVQDVGTGGREFQIRVQGRGEEAGSGDADAVKAGLRERFGEGTYDVLRVETVGATVGKDLWRQATLAVLIATVLMGIYIWFRFDLAFGVGAAIALIHDVLFTIAALSIANMEFDLTT